MKGKVLIVLVLALVLAATATVVWAADPIKRDAKGNEIAWESSASSCNTIQEGLLTYASTHYLAGQPLQVGYDPYGYNYQAHMFNGSYCNVYLGGYGFPPYDGNDEAYLTQNPTAVNVWCWPYRDVELVMKWDDAWISNADCGIDGVGGPPDGKLDRHYGFATYIGSGAWETNHQSGAYLGENGETCHWTYFTKIIAAPADAILTGAVWYAADGTEIGPAIWGDFATIESVYNDPCGGYGGIEYLSPDHAGFGGW